MEISEISAMLGEALSVGDTVTANFEMPAAGRISVDAVVRNKNLFRYGFELLGPNGVRQEMKRACESLPAYEGGRVVLTPVTAVLPLLVWVLHRRLERRLCRAKA